MIGGYTRARTALAIGVPNLIRLCSYRVGVKIGLNPVRWLQASSPSGPFFHNTVLPPTNFPLPKGWEHEALYFGCHKVPLGAGPPDWFMNPLANERVVAPEREWWQIPDFDPSIGDIKTVWEASRFDWVLAFAQRARAGEAESLRRLNDWLSDWGVKNKPYCGPNWKCGQEASIRVMHLAMGAVILGQTHTPTRGLMALIRLHLQRIAPTIDYAVAQDNNHGTSEAAALFIGGSWLAAQGLDEGKNWQKIGQKWLENRAMRLIEADGSFSQYSLNYHRVMLDTLCMAEIWRRRLKLDRFSTDFESRCRAAANWLYNMISPVNGDGPNLGANDGARLLPLTDSDYRDYRPSVQLAMALFSGQRAYSEDSVLDSPLKWLGIDIPDHVVSLPESRIFDDGGYAVLRRGRQMALMRYPRFRFRPSQADALHVDLWKDGVNLLRDAGTYSYNCSQDWLRYFPGTVSHNTIQFDDRDQMPRLGRFLFGNWLKTEKTEPLASKNGEIFFAASYQDDAGAHHFRRLCLNDKKLCVEDHVRGFKHKAVLRWRLAPGDWVVDDNQITNGADVLSIRSSVPIARLELVQGWESRYYLQKVSVPVLEIEVNQSGKLISEYCWG